MPAEPIAAEEVMRIVEAYRQENDARLSAPWQSPKSAD